MPTQVAHGCSRPRAEARGSRWSRTWCWRPTHREQKRQFARQIVDADEARQAAKRFDRLVLVAPAVTMGDLRAALPAKVKAAVTAEVVADLTNTPTRELAAHLSDYVPM